jgi:hypothetical protein
MSKTSSKKSATDILQLRLLRKGNSPRKEIWSGLGAPGDLYRYISESLISLKLMQKNKAIEMG